MGLTLSRLRALHAVVETGGFSAAARRLGQSQASVSQQLRDLEAAFSVSLLERRGRELVPSALCLRLYDIAGRILTGEAEALHVLTRHRDLLDGELRVGLGNAMPGMALLDRFQKLCPGIELQIEMGSWGRILDAVTEGRVHLGILPDVPGDGRFRRQACARQCVVAVVPPGHALATRDMVRCADLMQERLIFRARGSSTQKVVDEAFRRSGLKPRPAIVLDTRDGVFDAVANDLGVGFMWDRGTSRVGGFVQVPCEEMAAERIEYIFARQAGGNTLVDLFFGVSRDRIETVSQTGPTGANGDRPARHRPE